MKQLETKSTVLLKHHLKQLKLPTMESECEETALRCAKENVDHLGYLLQMAERELLEREARATGCYAGGTNADSRVRAGTPAKQHCPNLKCCLAGVPALESFDFKSQPSLNKMLVNELMRGAYLVNRESIILIGQPGLCHQRNNQARRTWPRRSASRRVSWAGR